MVTYKDIQEWIKDNFGISVKTCWIADVKERCGLSVKRAPNRQGGIRKHPCPSDKIDIIKQALKHFGII